jgi:hypothetical protein
MSTNSRLGLRLEDGSILSVYHHWDGYPEWLGVTLNKYYNTRESIAELIDGGNMSCCYTDSDWEHEELKTYRPLYYTERGEKLDDNAPKLSKDEAEYLVTTDKCCGEFAYIFELNNTWRCIGLDFWNPETKTFNDTVQYVEKTIPADYPSQLEVAL